MTAPLILLGALVVVGLALYIHHRLTGSPSSDEAAAVTQADHTTADGECCGMHAVCERDSLLATVSARVEYYDDEELDRFRGRGADEYSDAETEEFRDVLLTLLPSDIAGWGRSLQLRGIALPAPVKDELLLIVSEERSKHTSG